MPKPTEKPKAEGFYEALAICKDDLREAFKGNKKALAKIDSLDDTDMHYFASKFGEALTSDNWTEHLKITFESRFLEVD